MPYFVMTMVEKAGETKTSLSGFIFGARGITKNIETISSHFNNDTRDFVECTLWAIIANGQPNNIRF